MMDLTGVGELLFFELDKTFTKWEAVGVHKEDLARCKANFMEGLYASLKGITQECTSPAARDGYQAGRVVMEAE